MDKKKQLKQKSNLNVVVCAIASLTLLEVIAMLKGINGTLFSFIIATIAGLAGLSMEKPKIFK